MKTAYPALIVKNGDDYLIYVPDLDACTQGKSIPDAMVMARDLIGLSLVVKEDYGEKIPVPSDYRTAVLKAGKVANEELDFSNGLVTLVDIDSTEYRRKSDNRMVKKNCTIPNYLNRQAEAKGLNFSRVLQEALIAKLAD